MTPQEREEIGRIVEAKLESVLKRVLGVELVPSPPPPPVTDFQRAKQAALDALEKSRERRQARDAKRAA